ncbi:LamG-like jellyroll fold domain-containing protein [Catenuloplanes japonicus]|uniref:LamG-like jellyroll fold domain-containing protein n=1 Tax=Catenuloplanes japonicus TaxID=33876 RepID=UPI0005269269|nr:LamG-like jellyroll fold domain-containing protein [Catenuloplanes japonicus]
MKLAGRVAVVLTLLTGTIAVSSSRASAPAPTVPVASVSRAVSVRFTFDAGAGKPVVDASGRYLLRARSAVGGVLGFSRHGAGWAAVFPARCAALPQNCPRTILEGGDPAVLNPGVRRLQYGAAVLMRPTDTADGANVVQKGFSVGGGTQYKLQVDGIAGRPSCVVASPTHIYRVVAPLRVADGRWHALGCVRAGSALSISVDGVRRGSTKLPATLSIVNAEPLRIGGKSVTVNNDQYAGLVDDVYVTIN